MLSSTITARSSWLVRAFAAANIEISSVSLNLATIGLIYATWVDGVEGLVHVSEMSWSTHLRSAQDFVSVGDELQPGDNVLSLEAMKMENVIKSPGSGRVKSIPVQQGIAVEKSAVLIEFE